MTLKVTSDMVTSLDASKISGTLPALDGSSLTGITVGFADVTSSTDPLYTTNPAGGVGTIYINTTTGQLYICTDATTNLNVWTNVGGGSGDVEPPVSHAAGSTYGYVAGGFLSNYADENLIEQFPYATESVMQNHGNLRTGKGNGCSGQSSTTHGYVGGGRNPAENTIDKFAFSSNVTATGQGTLTLARAASTGHYSETQGYTAGGHTGSTTSNIIDTFSFASPGNASDHGDLSSTCYYLSGQTSETHGYVAGGTRSGNTNVIERYSFSNTNGASDCGDLSAARNQPVGCQTITHGYVCGGFDVNTWGNTDIVDKFTFAASVTTSGHGTLTTARHSASASTEKTYGFISGGMDPFSTVVDKFAFDSNTNGAGHADLSVAKAYMSSGHEV